MTQKFRYFVNNLRYTKTEHISKNARDIRQHKTCCSRLIPMLQIDKRTEKVRQIIPLEYKTLPRPTVGQRNGKYPQSSTEISAVTARWNFPQ